MNDREQKLETALRALLGSIADLPDQRDCAEMLKVTDCGDGGRGHRVRYIYRSDIIRAQQVLESE